MGPMNPNSIYFFDGILFLVKTLVPLLHQNFNFKYTKRINHSKFVICSIEGPISAHKVRSIYRQTHNFHEIDHQFMLPNPGPNHIPVKLKGVTVRLPNLAALLRFHLPFETNFRRIFFTKCARFEFAKPRELFRFIIFC